ncbi:MAG: transcriptional regulator [Hyphomicrobiaceae bacterium]|jgi:transcriptional regulator
MNVVVDLVGDAVILQSGTEPMLYNPPAFKVEDRETLHEHIRQAGLATLVTNGVQGPMVSHVPLLLDAEAGEHGMLLGHMAKANPHWQSGDLNLDALAVFHGPDAYITPSWYASKQEHGRVVPTWNYAVVHARGRLTYFEDAARLRNAVERLTDRHEGKFAAPWAVSDAPDRFVEGQLKAIIGFELEITSLEGKHKVSQNRNDADRSGVVDGLGEAGDVAMQTLVKGAMTKAD